MGRPNTVRNDSGPPLVVASIDLPIRNIADVMWEKVMDGHLAVANALTHVTSAPDPT